MEMAAFSFFREGLHFFMNRSHIRGWERGAPQKFHNIKNR